MGNGSSHRGLASVRRLTQAHPRLVPVHGPVHASGLNQIEICFSIVQRKLLTPNALIARMRSRFAQSLHLKLAV